MEIQPFPKKLANKVMEEGGARVVLRFQGGDDNGYLNVEIHPPMNAEGLMPDNYRFISELSDEIEQWAWSVYSYSGAGDGYDYGDDITYNFQTMEAEHQFWQMEPSYEDPTEHKFEWSDET